MWTFTHDVHCSLCSDIDTQTQNTHIIRNNTDTSAVLSLIDFEEKMQINRLYILLSSKSLSHMTSEIKYPTGKYTIVLRMNSQRGIEYVQSYGGGLSQDLQSNLTRDLFLTLPGGSCLTVMLL